MIAGFSVFPLISYWVGLFVPKANVSNAPAPLKSDAKAKTFVPADSALQEQIRRCGLSNGKGPAVQFCISEAKRWHEIEKKNPPPPPQPKTALEQELAVCSTMSKTVAAEACKREAPAKVARLQKEAEERAKAEAADRRTPLQKALDRCRVQSGKTIQQGQCMREATKLYSGH